MILVAALLLAFPGAPDDPPPLTHRITGLFSREREDDLRDVVKKMTGVTLVGIDFDRGEATFTYDPRKLFKDSKEKDWLERFDNLLKSNSSHTFGARPVCTIPTEKLTRVEIGVVGLDCKGCCLAAYESISKLDGVEQATASFREGRVTALIDSEKTTRAALEEALKKRGVTLRAP
jgi:copper chaperone CopZ